MSVVNGENNGTQVSQVKRPNLDEKIMPFSVFLGGSCNPTTWRTDLAIPMLKKLGISYYNPQKSSWGPELMDLENQAKELAKVVLFVIDDQTRSVASMIEAAHCIGLGSNIVLCIKNIDPNRMVDGEKLSQPAADDYNRGRVYLMDLALRAGVPVFDDISEAIKCAAMKALELDSSEKR